MRWIKYIFRMLFLPIFAPVMLIWIFFDWIFDEGDTNKKVFIKMLTIEDKSV